jgi:hypothetical protein
VPLSTDVLITHTPAFGIRDASVEFPTKATGCEELAKKLGQVKPWVACSHLSLLRPFFHSCVFWQTPSLNFRLHLHVFSCTNFCACVDICI